MLKRKNAMYFKNKNIIETIKFRYNSKIWRQIIRNNNFDMIINNDFYIGNNIFLKTIKIYV